MKRNSAAQESTMPTTQDSAPPAYTLRAVADRHLNHVPGFAAQGVHAAIKKKRRDVAVLFSTRACRGATATGTSKPFTAKLTACNAAASGTHPRWHTPSTRT